MGEVRKRHAPAFSADRALAAMGDEVHQYTKRDLAERLDCAPTTVTNAIRRLGISHDTRPLYRSQQRVREAILSLGDQVHTMTPRQVAGALGLNHVTVSRELFRQGLWTPRGYSPTEAAIIELGAEIDSMSRQELSHHLGVQPSTISLALQRLGIRHRSPGGRGVRKPEAYRELLSLGDLVHTETLGRMAEVLECSRTAITIRISTLRIERGTGRLPREVRESPHRSPRRDARRSEDAILALGTRIYTMTKAQIGELVGVREMAISRAMGRLGITDHDGRAAAEGQRPRKHGQPTMWVHYGCTCEICTEAKAEYKAREYRRRRMRFDPRTAEHGTRATYAAGCDCPACTKVATEPLRARNQETLVTADHHAQEWTGPQVEYALRRDLPIREIAETLGRSYNAVSNVRAAVKREDAYYLELLGRTPEGR